MRALFFHNKYDAASRALLTSLEGLVEVVDFMEARDTYRFRGTPCVWIGGYTPEDRLWQKSVDVTLQDVQDALGRVRELRISGPSSCGIGTRTYTVTALDYEGKPASLPEGTTLSIGDQSVPVDPDDPELSVTFADPGVYTLKVAGKESVPSALEVVVGG